MAWLEKRGDSFHLCFRLGNEKFKKSLKTTEQDEADATRSQVSVFLIRLITPFNGGCQCPASPHWTNWIRP